MIVKEKFFKPNFKIFLLFAFLILTLIHCVSDKVTSPMPHPNTGDNQLIDIIDLEELNAIRYDLDGNGVVDATVDTNGSNIYRNAFPDLNTNISYQGYELVTNLDFADSVWATNPGWDPIGTYDSDNNNVSFRAVFEGNHHTISGLHIHRANSNNIGLFGGIQSNAEVRNLALINVNITGYDRVGGLVGQNSGTIRASYATGVVSGRDQVGGLVGENLYGTIRASYATANVTSGNDAGGGLVGWNNNRSIIIASYATGMVSASGDGAGGLVGWNTASSTISASYATGSVTGNDDVGGFVGNNVNGGTIRACYAIGMVSGTDNDVGGFSGINTAGGSIHDGYYDTNATGQTTSDGGTGKTTMELQMPTNYTGIYSNWNDADGDDTSDDYWDFGSTSQYPLLKVDFNGDGMATMAEFGSQ